MYPEKPQEFISQNSIKQREEVLNITTTTAPLMIWMARCDTVYYYFNLTWLKFRGRELAEEIGDGWLEGVHPEDRYKCHNTYYSGFKEHQKIQREYRLLRSDGEYRWILDISAPIWSIDGAFMGYSGYCVDITDTKATRFFQMSLDMLCIANFNGYFQEINPAWEDILGWTEEELKAIPFIEFIHPDDREKTLLELEKKTSATSTVYFENRCRCKDGAYKWLLWSSKGLPEEKIFYVSARDITERKQREEALQASHHLLHSVIDSTPDIIFAKDIQGRYIMVNSTCAQFFDKPIKTIVGKDDSQFFPLEILRPIWQTDSRITTTGVAETLEEVVICNGIEKTYLTTKSPWRDPQGNIIGVIGITRDITERKLASEALRQTEAKNRAILNAIPDLMFRISKDGIYLDVMAASEGELVASAREIIGKSIYELLPPEIATKSTYYTQQALATKTIQLFEYQIFINGELQDYEARIVPSGEDEVLAMVRDITTNKRTERTLQALVAGTASVTGEEFFQALVKHLAAALQVRYALAVERVNQEHPKGRVLAFWAGDKLGANFEYNLANTPCEFVGKNEGVVCYSSQIQQLFPLDRHIMDLQVQSYLGAPLLDISGTVLGHLCVLDTKPILHQERLESIITVFAARATVELQRQRTENALRQSEKQFRELASKEILFNRLANQIRNSLDINTILDTAVTEVRKLLQIDRCCFIWYRLNPELPYWEVVSDSKHPAMLDLLGLKATNAEIGSIALKTLNREIIRIDNIENECDSLAQKFFLSLGFTATLSLPIHTNSGEIGTFSCSHYTSPRPWLDSEVELLLAVIDQVAIAIDQAELYKQSRLAAKNAEEKAHKLQEALSKLQQTQAQLVQSEKMSSLGQLVAGIAHEINNPVNFIHGNINHAVNYTHDLLQLVELYQRHYPQPIAEIRDEIEAIDLDFVSEDLPKLLSSMKLGTDRIRQIVLSLRNFSRLDEADMKAVDIHEGIDNSLLLLQNRLKFKPGHSEIEVIKEYGDLPLVECYAGQLNQVFMNLLANAIDAIEELDKTEQGQICIRTFVEGMNVAIHISDNGPGMSEEVRQRLFDPFFTTKPVGKGTGMGLSISYKIVVEKHQGQIQCISAPGQGAEFIVSIRRCQ